MPEYKNHSEKLSKIKTGELSLSENVAGFLQSIKSAENINAFNFVFENDATASAKIFAASSASTVMLLA